MAEHQPHPGPLTPIGDMLRRYEQRRHVAALFAMNGMLVAEVPVDTDETHPTVKGQWPAVIVYGGEAFLQSDKQTGVYNVARSTYLHS